MIISKREQKQQMDLMTESLKNLINQLTTCNIKELPEVIESNLKWERPREGLFIWIPVLNRIDEVFEDVIKRYELDNEDPKLQIMSDFDQRITIACLKFTFMLLDHCYNRSIYNSTERIYDLLKSPSVDVRVHVLEVLLACPEFFTDKLFKKVVPRLYPGKENKMKVLLIATSYPPLIPQSFLNNQTKSELESKPTLIGDHYSFLDTLKTNKKYPSKWKSLNYQYFNSEAAVDRNEEKKNKRQKLKKEKNDTSKSNKKEMKNSRTDGLSSFVLSEDAVRKLTLEQIFDKANEKIPKDQLFEFGLFASVVKSFNNRSYEAIKLREKLLRCKILAVAFICCTCSTEFTSSKLFETEPYILSFLTELVEPENKTHISKDVYFSAIKSLECITLNRVWGGDIIRSMGGNVSHGVLFQIIRRIHKEITEDLESEIFEKANVHFFNMISNLFSCTALLPGLVSAGLLDELLTFFNLKSKYRWSCSAATHLTALFLNNSTDSLDSFIQKDGFNLLIETINYEVNFALENPNYGGGAPKDSSVYYKISFRQANYIRNLMKFVTKLLYKTPGDRARNLYDSSLLNVFNKIFLNAAVFGPDIVSETLGAVSIIINNEPTAFSILNEANVITTILDQFESLFAPSSDMFINLPDVIGTFSLIKTGLKLVIEKKSIQKYFKSFYDLQIVKHLNESDSSYELGNVFLEMSRHHPDLKPIIITEIVSIMKNMPSYANERLDGIRFYTSQSGSLYHNKDEDPLIFEEGSKEIESWNSTSGAYFIDNTLQFIECLKTPENNSFDFDIELQKRLSMDHWLDYLMMENLPYDIYNSYGISSLMLMFEALDEDREYGFPKIILTLNSLFEDPLIQSYIRYDDPECSFFSRYENDGLEGTKFLKKFNILNNILYTVSKVYLTRDSSFHERQIQAGDLFSSKYPNLINYITCMLKRSILEETILRASAPDIIGKETVPTTQAFLEFPPLQIFTHDPNNDAGKKKEGTSAKFKNTLQIRFLLYHIQGSISIILKTVGRISMGRDQETGEHKFRREAVDIALSIGKCFTTILDTEIEDINIRGPYQMVLLNICSHILTQRYSTGDNLITSLVISFYQNGFFDVLRKVGVSLWNSLLTQSTVSKVDFTKLKFVTSDLNNILSVALSHVFALVGKTVDENYYPVIPHFKMYFATGYKDNDSSLIPRLLVQTKLMASDFIESVISPELLNKSANFKNIPHGVMEQIIIIYKQILKNYKEVLADLIFFNKNNIVPTDAQVQFLGSAGLNIEQINRYFDKGYRIENFGNLSNLELSDLEISTEVYTVAQMYYEENKSDVLNTSSTNINLKKLQEVRVKNKKNFMNHWIDILLLFPDNIKSISDLFTSLSDPSKISNQILANLKAAISSGDIKRYGVLSNVLKLLFKNDKVIKANRKIFQEYVDFFIAELLDSKYVKEEFFSVFLEVFLQILIYDDIPNVEESDLIGPSITGQQKLFTLQHENRKLIFERITQLEGFQSLETANAIVNILILYSREYEYGKVVSNSKVLREILNLLKQKSNSQDNLQSLQTSLVILLRRCFETNKIIESQIEAHIPKMFSSIRSKRDLGVCLKDTSSLILRNPEIYVDVFSKYVRLDGYLGKGDLNQSKVFVKFIEPEKDHDVVMEDVEGNENRRNNINSTGIIHILLTELMEVSKKDWISDPENEETSNKQKKGDKREDLFKNLNFSYASFLLQTIIELVGSYKQCKLEFLTFSRKKQTDVLLKPRATALNFLIHQLVPTKSLVSFKGPEFNRRAVISSLAKVTVLALVSTPLSEINNANPKVENIDMAFIRKFYAEVLSKTLSETYQLPNIAIDKYGKLIDIFQLCGSVITPKFRQLAGFLLDDTATKYDQYFIAKALIEKHIPQQITNIMAGLDMNFPSIGKVIKAGVKPISILGKVKVDFLDLFEANYQGDREVDEIVPEDMDDREETPDLFRNSTLGMYDVNIDSEGEMDYFDEDDALDVLMSEEEISDSDGSSVLSDLDDDDDDDVDVDDNGNDISIVDGQYDSGDIIMEDGDDHSELGEEIEILDDLDIEGDSEGDSFSESDFSDSSGIYEIGEEGDDISEYDPEELDVWIEEFESDNSSNSANESGDEHNDEESSLFIRHGTVGNPITSSRVETISDDEDEEALDIEIEGRNGNRSSVLDLLGPQSNPLSREFFISNLPYTVGGWLDADTFNLRLRPTLQSQSILDQIFEGTIPISAKENPDQNNKYIKSIKERWLDTMKMFHEKDKDDCSIKVIPAIINRIAADSIELNKKKLEEAERVKKAKEEKMRKREEERLLREKEMHERQPELHEASTSDVVPVMVRVGDREVDIGGTDIDPEFFEALPDDMREEVLTQHIRERRAQATSSGTETREIDPDFLDALPEQIREEILQQENVARRFSIMDDMRFGEEEFEEIDENSNIEDDTEINNENTLVSNLAGANSTQKKKNENKKPCFFTPLLEKQGISSIVRLLFVPQSIMQREFIHHALQYLCYSKQSRVEIMGILLTILHEGINQRSMEKIYSQISFRSSGIKGSNLQIPIKATSLVVALQVLEAIHHLLEKNSHLRYYLLTEHENPFLTKNLNHKKKLSESAIKDLKYPINYLFKLLDNDILKEEQTFMDILARILQISTRPLHALEKANKNDSVKSSPFIRPLLTERNFRQVIKLLTSNECPNSTFRRSVSAMQNLSILPGAHKTFCVELSDQASKLGQNIIIDLNNLTRTISSSDVFDAESKGFAKFSSPSSDQAKLLRILTALDYMFESKEKEKEQDNLTNSKNNVDEIEELTSLYNKLALGTLWDALSDCLRVVEDNPSLTNVSTVLLPLIEALMVVCKHSKVRDLQVKDVIKYEVKKIDFAKEPIESLFLSFTDEHKKVLNQMVRSNPNLMSGPFAMLVRNSRVLEFDNKKNYFDRKLHVDLKDSSKLAINIRRDQVFLDSYRSLFFKSKDEFRTSKLEVAFKGEAGIDAGGVTREWYQVLSRQMFNPDYALFTPVASDVTTFHPNRTSYVNPEHLSFFKFIGRIIGKAIYDNCFLDCHFSRAVYKRILGIPVSLKDMETLDLEYFKSLIWMLENDITDIITEDFSVETDDYGEHKIIELIPNGSNIPVTEENKNDYVRKVVEYRLQTSVSEQMDNFLIGFHEIIPKDLVSIFDEQELELLISGLPDIDVQDWQYNTTYNNYSASSVQIQWFWRAVKSFDNEQRARLLQFATGTSKVPLNGFKALGGAYGGTCKFSIHRDYGSTDRLPSSHTCFNQIDLPAYENYETLRGSLLLAITEGHEGFGLS